MIEKTKELIIDQVEVALASSTLSWNHKVLEHVQDVGISGESQVIGTSYRAFIDYAALVNGLLEKVASMPEIPVKLVQNGQNVQAVQNVWNDLNYLNGWNSDDLYIE